MPFEPWLIVLTWLLWLGIAAQCALAVHGYLVERREGMRISRLRLSLLVSVFGAASAVTLFLILIPRQHPLVVATQQERAQSANPELEGLEKQDGDIRAELAQIQSEQGNLDERRRTLVLRQHQVDPRIEALRGVKASPVHNVVVKIEEVDWRTRAVLAVAALVALLLIGFLVLALGGQIQTLFPDGWSLFSGRTEEQEALQRDLDALASLVWSEKYCEALEKAESIPDKKLRSFDQLDYLFLRAYSAVQLFATTNPANTEEQRRNWIDTAVRDLEVVTFQAPQRAEAVYTLAVAHGLTQKYAEGLQGFEQSQQMLPSEKNLPFEHNQSVCLLRLAELSLSTGNTQQAESYFARVAGLGKLTDSVAQSRVRIGMIDLRNAMNRQDMATASAALEKIAGLRDLSKEQKSQVDVICSALNARIALRRDDAQLALTESSSFLSRHLPTGLPPLEDQSVDEPFSPVVDADIPFPREVFQGFLFIQAVALSRIETKSQAKPTESQIAKLSEPLLRALQFVPRQRDLLGALGGLYYWFRREKRSAARLWLEAAASMGVRGRIVRAILERDRLVEMEQREALDWFRSASSRFLRDPALAGEVRRALVEELGRFQEFEPMLISLQEKPELEQEEPTIQGLRDRSNYLAELLASIVHGGQPERFTRLTQIHAEYSTCLSKLEEMAQTISTLERRVFSELADALVLR
jgi:hypothetical protein